MRQQGKPETKRQELQARSLDPGDPLEKPLQHWLQELLQEGDQVRVLSGESQGIAPPQEIDLCDTLFVSLLKL